MKQEHLASRCVIREAVSVILSRISAEEGRADVYRRCVASSTQHFLLENKTDTLVLRVAVGVRHSENH